MGNSQDTPDALQRTLKRYEESHTYQKDHWFDKWERDNKLYDGERALVSYEGLADTFVPMTFPMIETMVNSLANGTLRFDFASGDPLKDPDTRALNGLIDEWWESEGWDLNVEEGIREMGITGMAGNMLSWDIDHPEWDAYAMRDMIVDPTISRPEDLQDPGHYAGRRYYVRKGALEEYEVLDTDPKSKTYGELIPRYNIPADSGISPTNSGDEETDKKLKEEMFGGSTLSDADKDQDEIIEIWDVDRVVTVMNRQYVIEDRENPYKARHRDLLMKKYTDKLVTALTAQGIDYASTLKIAEAKVKYLANQEAKGINPFFFFRNYRRLSLFYAKSEIDSTAKHQELINDLSNLETDILIKKAKPARELDPLYEDWKDLVDGDDYDRVYPFKPGSLQPVLQPDASPNLFARRQDIKNEMREATAISYRSKGMDSPTDPTATEVRSTDRGTDSRIQSKARILEKDGFYWFAKILFRMIQLYVTEPMVVKVSGPSRRGKESGVYRGKQLPPGTAVFDPADYDSDFIPTISLEVDSMQKKAEDKKSAFEEFQVLIQDPTNNLDEVKRIYYPKMFDLDKADLDAILTPVQQPGMPGAGAVGMGAQAVPTGGSVLPIAPTAPLMAQGGM